ncbi:MAG: hypothetical protein JWO47_624 [Candidatus Saccharibacteria bacterium]|nr:hypothetical protein [Candidatus Saccharibacteria bacterium]
MSNTATKPAKKVNGLKVLVAFLGIIVIVAALGFAIQLLRGSARADDAEAPKRPTIAASYQAIPPPSELKLSEHQTVSTGTPSEVYFYTFTTPKLTASDDFAAALQKSGYSVVKGTDGLLFSASKDATISLNFTFSDPNQLKVVAI